MVNRELNIKKIVKLDNEIFKHSKWNKDNYANSENFTIDNVGFLSLLGVGDHCDILRMGILEEYRRQGMAKKLIKSVIDIIPYTTIFLEVNTDNLEAIALYNSIGFKSIYVRENYYQDKDAIVMKYCK